MKFKTCLLLVGSLLALVPTTFAQTDTGVGFLMLGTTNHYEQLGTIPMSFLVVVPPPQGHCYRLASLTVTSYHPDGSVTENAIRVNPQTLLAGCSGSTNIFTPFTYRNNCETASSEYECDGTYSLSGVINDFDPATGTAVVVQGVKAFFSIGGETDVAVSPTIRIDAIRRTVNPTSGEVKFVLDGVFPQNVDIPFAIGNPHAQFNVHRLNHSEAITQSFDGTTLSLNLLPPTSDGKDSLVCVIVRRDTSTTDPVNAFSCTQIAPPPAP